MRFVVDLCQFIAALFLAPIVLYRSWRTGKYRSDWDQRRGFMPELPQTSADRPRVWIHAVSVGEMNAVRGLIERWRAQSPATQFVISCTTDTGIARARELFPDLTIIRYPLDFSRFVRRALDRIKPDLIVLVELEVWFNFVTMAAERGIPVAVINGRLTEKSLRWFLRIASVARRMFGALTWVGAQDEAFAERFRRAGVPTDRVTITGSLKWETAQIADTIPGALDLAQAMGIRVSSDKVLIKRNGGEADTGCVTAPFSVEYEMPAYPIWVCGSTGPGEEEIILQVHKTLREKDPDLPNLQLVIVPRKPERFDEVAGLIEQSGFACVRRTQCRDSTTRSYDRKAVQLVDTMGELRKVYSLADVVLVGRSLVPMGGSDVMEVAALGKPIIVGPYTGNFRDAVQQLEAAHAIWVVDRPERQYVECLPIMIWNVLGNAFRHLGPNAREVVRRNLGATQRTLEHLLKLQFPDASTRT
jgi:3-deoxy-D-manno-octulosonic-acid transferase